MCITTYRVDSHWAKLVNHGAQGIWSCYADGHSTGMYHVFNHKTKNIILTLDVTFLQKPYGEYSKIENHSW